MKKIFLFLALAAVSVSCSNDDGGSGDSIRFKVNGVSKRFTNINVNEEVQGSETWLEVTATRNESFESITFDVYRGETGTNVINNFTYAVEDMEYFNQGASIFITDVVTNSEAKLTGNFAGLLDSTSDQTTVTIDEGTFDISF